MSDEDGLYELTDKDVTVSLTPGTIRKMWRHLHQNRDIAFRELALDDDTLRQAAFEVFMSKFPDLVEEIVELAKDYEEAQTLRRVLHEEYLESAEADPWPD